jgi:glycosyltransferase involved in cell wall biosynthesis
MNKIVLLAPVNFLRSYSGFQYLADYLHSQGYKVEVFAHIPVSQLEETITLPYVIHSCYSGFFGKIPKIRHFFFKRKIRNRLKNSKAVVLNSTGPNGYFKEAIEYKQSSKRNIFIQYCTEIWDPTRQSVYSATERAFYNKNSNIADIIIDVEKNRAKYRKELFKIKKEVLVIPNTLPKKNVVRIKDLIKPRKSKIIYTGVFLNESLYELISITKSVSDEITIDWFAHGNQVDIEKVNQYIYDAGLKNKIILKAAIPRSELLELMQDYDAGLIIYSFKNSTNINLKYAAPTKLFEYISNGLAVISYGNPSIKNTVERHDLGICSELDDPSELGLAINELFKREDFESLGRKVQDVFFNELCYEAASASTFNVINKLLKDSDDVKDGFGNNNDLSK